MSKISAVKSLGSQQLYNWEKIEGFNGGYEFSLLYGGKVVQSIQSANSINQSAVYDLVNFGDIIAKKSSNRVPSLRVETYGYIDDIKVIDNIDEYQFDTSETQMLLDKSSSCGKISVTNFLCDLPQEYFTLAEVKDDKICTILDARYEEAMNMALARNSDVEMSTVKEIYDARETLVCGIADEYERRCLAAYQEKRRGEGEIVKPKLKKTFIGKMIDKITGKILE